MPRFTTFFKFTLEVSKEFKKSSIFSEPIARIKEGRLLIVTRCNNEWCEVKTENLNGWVKKKDLWGDIN